jgi:hypothetical protein
LSSFSTICGQECSQPVLVVTTTAAVAPEPYSYFLAVMSALTGMVLFSINRRRQARSDSRP